MEGNMGELQIKRDKDEKKTVKKECQARSFRKLLNLVLCLFSDL